MLKLNKRGTTTQKDFPLDDMVGWALWRLSIVLREIARNHETRQKPLGLSPQDCAELTSTCTKRKDRNAEDIQS